MSFFNLSTGTNATENNVGTFESGGGVMEPIPANTSVLATCEEAKIDTYEGESQINIRWRVAKPEEHKNRVIFQRVRCWDNDPNKRDRAIMMLAAIDANAGGKLAATGAEPTAFSLQQSLVGHPMILRLDVWDLNGKTGNWVQAVSPAKQQAPMQQAATTPNLDDSDIPF